MNRYKAAGVQIDPEYGIDRHQLIDLLFLVDDDEYEIVSFDANNAICYFVFSYDYYENKIDGENLIRFKEKFIEIANDMGKASSDNIYKFDEELIYFGYY